MSEVHKLPCMNTEELREITKDVNLNAYIFKDPEYEKDVIVLRISTDTYEGIGLNLPPDMSEKIIKILKGENGVY